MGQLSLEREIKGHRVVVTIPPSGQQANVRMVPPASGQKQQEAMDIQPLLAGGMTKAEALERVMGLVTEWIEGRDGT